MEEKKYLTVTALTKYIHYKFDCDIHLKDVYLEGEISNFKRHSRGHFYFTLKDKNSAIGAMMFYNDAKNVLFEPKDGMNVLVKGNVSVYEPSGTYSITCYQMEQKGIGSLYLAYEKLKKELDEAGYFRPEHKKEIPLFPKAIAIITSPTGAAVRDCINTITRRYPLAKIYVYPTLVQGEEAKYSIVKNIKQANSDKLVDVIILGRGGGSIEDLWAFNEKIVIDEIYNSELPIISGVGHETDTTLSDYVADKRAATPTAAAELATPNLKVLMENVSINQRRIQSLMESYMNNLRQKLLHIDARLENVSPINRLNQTLDKIKENKKLIDIRFKQILLDKQNKLNLYIEKLKVLNPLLIMDKGFSIVTKDDIIVKDSSQVNVGDLINIRLKEGEIRASVKEVK